MSKHLDGYFFHSSHYHLINSGTSVEKISLEGSCFHLVIQNLSAYSAYKTTFGTITGFPSPSAVTLLLELLKGRVLKVYFTLPPLLFPESDSSLQALLGAGFTIRSVEISQQRSLDLNFRDGLTYQKKKRLNDAHHLITKQLTLEFFDDCFSLIEKNRFIKGYPLTMKREDLRRLMENFPERYLLFGTFNVGQLIACSVSIDLGYGVFYHFYWADDLNTRSLNPLIHLNNFTYNYAKENGFKMIDFGVSSVDSKINRGLFRFKKELGAVTTKKYYLEYSY